MTLRLMQAAALTLVAACGSAPSSTAAQSPGERPFRVTEVADFSTPWAMDFLPGSGARLTTVALVTEKEGRLWLVNTATGARQPVSGVPRVKVAGQGGLGDVVVIHLGANQDPLDESDLDRMMAALADVPQVLFVTNRLNESYIFEQNALIRTLPSRYSNVTVMDWAEIGNSCPGACFASDNLHLNADGADYYADQVMSALGLE